MSRPKYQLLASDLDGTILQHDEFMSARVKRAIASAQERGVQVALATGRSYQSALPYARLLDIHLPLICYQGGLIQDPNTGQSLHKAILPKELVQETIALCQEQGWQLLLYTENEILLTEYRYPKELYHQKLGPTVRKADDLATATTDEPIKLTVLESAHLIPAVEEEMRARFAGRMEVFRSHAMFVEASPLGVSKGSALAWLADHLGVPQHQVMAIGDQDNDAPMVSWAGLGIAMGNGSPGCKNAADWIAPSIEENGCAVAIERFLLQ